MATLLGYWWVLALVSGMGLAARNILFKLAGSRIDPAMGAVILSISMAATALVFFFVQRYVKGESVLPEPSAAEPGQWGAGVALAVFSGIGVGLANIFLAYTYDAGGPASLTAILQNAAALSLTVVIGALILGETIQPIQFIGILLAVTGVFLIVKA